MIKIVYFSDARIPSEMANSVSIINLCNAFTQLGVDINLVKPWRFRNRNINSDDIYKIYGIKNKFNIVNTPYLDLSIFEKIFPNLILRPANYFTKRVWQRYIADFIVNKFSPDVIHMRNNIPFALNHLTKKNKFVLLEFYDEPSKFYLDIYKRSIVGNKKLILTAITSNLADRISELFQIDRKIIEISPSGVDKSRFSKTALNSNKVRKTIMYIGSLHSNRGIDNFILASKNVNEHDFIIIGGTKEDSKKLKAKFNLNNKSNLSFISHQTHSQKSNYYDNADIVILPMTSNQTHTKLYASPNKLFEYMASGKPIIASDLPSINEVVSHNHSALLFKPDDSIDLTEKIYQLVNNKKLSEKLSLNSFDLVDNYTWETKAKNMLDLIKDRKS